MDINELRAKRLREAVEKSGLSFVELEHKTGVPKSTLQRYVAGKTKKIPIDCLEQIALATGSDIVYLMGWETEKSSPVPEGTEDEWLEKLLKLNEDELLELRNYVRYLRYKRDHAADLG